MKKTKYKPEFAPMLVEHMKGGMSFESFGSVIGCHFDTMYKWAKLHKEFYEAKRLGETHARLYWEDILRRGAMGILDKTTEERITIDPKTKLPKSILLIKKNAEFNCTAAIFALKNKFPKEWRDRKELDLIDDREREMRESVEEIEAKKIKIDQALARMKERRAQRTSGN